MRTIALSLLVVLAGAASSFGQNKQIVELQRDMALLQDQVRTMQRAFDEKMAGLTVLIQQTLDNTNKAATAVAVLESGIRDRMREQEKTLVGPVAGLGSKVDQMASEFQFVKESVNDMSSQMRKLQAQMVDLNNAVKIMQSPPAPPGAAPAGGTSTAPPAGMTADSLYQNALRAKLGGQTDFALQQFTDFLKYYGATDLAANAQFYIGEIAYQSGDMEAAMRAFDAVLEKYPDNNKTLDAMLLKGRALLKTGQRTAAANEFRALIQRSPNSEQASRARAELKALGMPYSAPASSKKRPGTKG